MKNVLVLTPSKNGINEQTRQCIQALIDKGAQFINEPKGCSDVALARNIGLTLASNRLQEYVFLDTVLMIDDDMFFSVGDAERIIKESKTGVPASGACVTSDGKFFGKPISKTKWACGLAFMAIPRQIILDMAARSKIIELDKGGKCLVFTWNGANDKSWCGEDQRLCHRMGGVQVLPIRIGHLKIIPIYPANEGQEKELDIWMNKQLGNYNG